MGIFFGFQIFICRKQKIISKIKNKEQSFTLQKSVENFTLQQKVLLHIKMLYYVAESFTALQKSQSCDRNWRKVHSAAKTEDKPTLQHLPLDFGLNVCAQSGSGRMVLWSPFHGALDPTSFLEKAQTKLCPITSRRVSKVQET